MLLSIALDIILFMPSQLLAEVSKYYTSCDFASYSHSSYGTTLSSTKSILFPTKTLLISIAACSVIDFIQLPTELNVLQSVTSNTIMTPWALL